MARKTIKQKNEELKPLNKQLKHYGLVLCILPTEKQVNLVNQTFGCSRLIYNKYLSERQNYYKENKKSLSVSDFKKNYLNPLKKTDEFKFLKDVDKFALESAVENVEDAFNRFFKKQNGFPKFKTKRKAISIFTFPFLKYTLVGIKEYPVTFIFPINFLIYDLCKSNFLALVGSTLYMLPCL